MLNGLIPVLLTPMKENSTLDEAGLERLIEYVIAGGAGGIWALGSAAEEINIGFEQKVEIALAIDRIVAGRIPVIMGTGAVSIYDHKAFLDKTSVASFAGVHLLPFDLKMGKSRTINLFETISDYSPCPVWMYHNPKRGRPFEISTIEELSQHDNIGGIKIGGYNLSELTRAFMLRRSDFDVVAAGSGQVYQAMTLGAKAHTTSEGSVLPGVFKRIIDLYNAGDHAGSLALQQKWILLNAQIPRTDNGEHAAEEKFMLSTMGICEDWVNPNYSRLSPEQQGAVRAVFEDMMAL